MTALVLGVLGLLACPLLAPFAWAIGKSEIAAIDAGRRPPENRQLARIGWILGIVVTWLWILFVVLVIAMFVLNSAALGLFEDAVIT